MRRIDVCWVLIAFGAAALCLAAGCGGSGSSGGGGGSSSGSDFDWELTKDPALPKGFHCNEDADCQSGYCYDEFENALGYCSGCASDSDCGPDQSCDFVDDITVIGDGVAKCRGSADLGAQCSKDTDCESNLCNMSTGSPGACSECRDDTDCPNGGTCTQTSGYFVCERGLGADCSDASDCNSNYCIDSSFNSGCATCGDDGDCAEGLECAARPEDTFRSCHGSLYTSTECSSDEQCASGFCDTETGGPSRCAECETDADCGYGSRCRETGAGEYRYLECQGGRGDDCSSDADCHPEFVCFLQSGTVTERCSECNDDADCPNGNCIYSNRNGFALCEEPRSDPG